MNTPYTVVLLKSLSHDFATHFHPVPIAYVILALLSLCRTWGDNGLTSCFLQCMSSPSCFFSPDRGDFPWMDVARGRNTLFQPVPFPSIKRPGWPGGGIIETRITACFYEGNYPRRHGENMETPHRKALSPTPRVWALMTQREEHAPSTL